ncbi:MAG TPA: fibronectin type III domain-containing protein [Pyrinomonadaceae bacterium]|nr:fibronectin type III domain-containing protein [Pyrinomonadaceae bacterium]
MTTRHYSRLLIGTAIAVLIVGMLFTGLDKTSAAGPAKGDRSAPTAPTNLAASNITETTVNLSWGGSSDNSGKFTYKVQITNLNNSAYNSLATVSQTQTTYQARYLAPNSSYTFTVYAVDGSGNKSANSNLVQVSTPKDTTPPAAPTLQATVLTPSQVKLVWSKTTDNVTANCCSYSINVNGAKYTGHINWISPAPAGSLAASIRHLTPNTNYSFSVSVADYSGGNVATSNTVSVKTDPTSDFTPPAAPTGLQLVRDDTCGEVWLGWVQTTDNADPQDVIEYEIWVNGVISPLPVGAGLDLDFVYGTNHGDNYFQIRAVDRSGNTSAPSNVLKLFLWPC